MAAASSSSSLPADFVGVIEATCCLPKWERVVLGGVEFNHLTNFHHVYRYLDRVGEGANGSLILLRDLRTDAIVAAKVISTTDEDIPYVATESEILSMANAVGIEGIPRVHSSFLTLPFLKQKDGSVRKGYDYVIVMDFLRGNNLESILTSKRDSGAEFPDSIVLDFAYFLFGVLAQLHRRGIAHRDIKPSNVILSGKGFYLVDFGFSCLTRQEDGGRFSCNTPCGSPLYTAPELLQKQSSEKWELLRFSEDAIYATDVWSAAATILDMSRYHKIMDIYAEAPSLYEASKNGLVVPGYENLPRLLNACLSGDPNMRPTAEEALEMVYGGEDTSNTSDSYSSESSEVEVSDDE